jgi:tetratricopeptide (TPR) repeat protein
MADCRLSVEQANVRNAVDCLHHVVELDPNFAQAWMALGMAQVGVHDRDEGIRSMQRAIELEPSQKLYYRPLATALIATKREAEALDVWKKLQGLTPDDLDVAKNIVSILVNLDRYQEALPQLERLVKQPGGSVFLLELADAYARTGQNDSAVDAFQRALQVDSSPDSLNAVAYVLTLDHLRLDLAQQYAEQGVRQREQATSTISLESLNYDNLRNIPGLGGDWDTLGWVYFNLGKYDLAERYLNAGWNLLESSTIGDHLGQVYEKLGRRNDAIEAYAAAIVAGDAPPNSSQRLEVLCGSNDTAAAEIEQARANLHRLRTVKVDFPAETISKAEFFVLLRQGPKVVDVRFIKGPDSLTNARAAIAGASFHAPFPNDAPTQLVRRGVLTCQSRASGCEFELIPPDRVQSIE